MHSHSRSTTKRSLISVGTLLLSGLLSLNSQAASFTLNDTTPGGMSAAALAGFQQAVSVWESHLADDVTINLDIRFDGSLAANVLGSTGSTSFVSSYTNVRTALTNDDNLSASDTTAVANLTPGSSLSFLTNDANTSLVVTDNNNSGNNLFLNVNRANAKALGLVAAHDAAVDATIAFNSAFSWDFDQTNGIGAGLQDFVGVTIHEIGHALGFTSGVDTVDATHGSGPNAPTDLDGFAVYSVLDLYRYSAAGQLDFSTSPDTYFSIDGGVTNIAPFSTGSFNGDGSQASHWEDDLFLGLLDPSANPPGQINTLSALDLQAFDVIGWEITAVPEPSSTALIMSASLIGLLRRRRA